MSDTYYNFITNIIDSRGRLNKSDNGVCYERHHIVPKCLGGTNSTRNLVDLTPQEHFIAHKLLLQEIGGSKLAHAYNLMINYRDNVTVSLEELNYAREQHRKSMSEAMKGENNPMYGIHRRSEDSPMFGKHHSSESRKKMSESRKGENNPFFGKHHSEETKKKIGEANKGRPAWCSGKHLSEETRKKISESWDYEKHITEEFRRKISESHKGKHHSEETKKRMMGFYWYTNGIDNIKARECPEGYYKGRTIKK